MPGLIDSRVPAMATDAEAPALAENARLQALRELDILDSAAEERFDRLTTLAATAFRAPIVMVSLVDQDRVWFKSKVGVQATEVPRDGSFCGHAIRGESVLVVPDARVDPRFSASPLVLDAPRVRFYAGAPLRTRGGQCVGTLCLIDDQPREFTADDQAQLAYLAGMAVQEAELRALQLRLARERTAREQVERVVDETSAQLFDARTSAEFANRAKTEFLANMGHELRTPLNGIIGFTQLLLQDICGPLQPRQREYLGDVERSALRLLDVFNQILAISSLELGRTRLHKEPIEPAEVLEMVRTAARETALRCRVALAIVCEPGLASFEADRAAVQEILLSLVKNALKFSPPGARVDVSARVAGDSIEFLVEDRGAGIPADKLPFVFEPFVQAESGLDRRFEGAGLGLPIARGLAEAHGGSVTLESEVGVGTRAHVRLPLR
jgi:signal transduction histidine kinase